MLMVTMHPSEDTGLTAGLKPSFNNCVRRVYTCKGSKIRSEDLTFEVEK